MFVVVCSFRLVDGSPHHPRCAGAHHPLLYLLLSVLPAEVLLLCALPLLPSNLLLPRERFKNKNHQLLTLNTEIKPLAIMPFYVCLAVMQHRLMKEAQKAMTPWMNGQPIYAPMSNHSSSYQMNPMLYAGQKL